MSGGAGDDAASNTKMKEKEKRAKDILNGASKVLDKVDKAHIFSILDKREFPIFQLEEIQPFGPELGTGGFSRVQEITQVHLKDLKDGNYANANETDDTNHDNRTEEEENKNQKSKPSQDEEDDDDLEMIAQLMKGVNNKDGGKGGKLLKDDEHYDVNTARQVIADRCIRKGSGARYCVKKLKVELDVVDRARGAVDLAIEIRYLSVLWHPNIVKMRGISQTPTEVSQDTFLLMDRLYGTLESKFEEWEQLEALNKASSDGGCCGCGGNSQPMDPAGLDFLKSRLLVAYDLTQAFEYLHGAKLVYRDIKPENIGFDIRGDVKVFDFGLCRSLDKVDKNPGYGYKLTAKTGSVPYMAPEVALGQPYDTKADVFSFAVLLWEILNVDWAFNGYSIREYFQRVVKENQRMPIKVGGSWSVIMKSIVKEGVSISNR